MIRKILILSLPVIVLLNMISIPAYATQPLSAKTFIVCQSDDQSPAPEPEPEPTPAPEPEPEPEPAPTPSS